MTNTKQLVAEVSPKRLQMFESLAATGSFKQAAQELFRAEVSLRQNIQALERAVGGALTTRNDEDPPGFHRLTPLGEQVRVYGSQVLLRCEALTRLGEQRRPAVAFLPHHAPLMAEVCREVENPHELMEMQVLGESERSEAAFKNRVLSRLSAGAIAVAVGHPTKDRNLVSSRLYTVDYEAMVPRHRAVEAMSLEELVDSGPLVLAPPATRSRSLLEERLAEEGLTPNVALEAFQTKVLVLMGWAGLGTVVLPSDLARLYKEGQSFGGEVATQFTWVKVVDRKGKRLTHDVNVTTNPSPIKPIKDVVAAIKRAADALDYQS